MRISKFTLGLALLGGCDGATTIDVPEADRIECALGSENFTRACAIERSGDPAILIVRHPDGGFRRFSLASDGTITAADGADAATGHSLPDGRLEIGIGGDRYRLPARK